MGSHIIIPPYSQSSTMHGNNGAKHAAERDNSVSTWARLTQAEGAGSS